MPALLLKLMQSSLGFRFHFKYYFNSKHAAPDKSDLALNRLWENLGVDVRLFPLKKTSMKCPEGHKATKFVQAGVDVAIACQILISLERGQLEHLCLLTGDGDFEMALGHVGSGCHGKDITVSSFEKASSRILKYATDTMHLKQFLPAFVPRGYVSRPPSLLAKKKNAHGPAVKHCAGAKSALAPSRPVTAARTTKKEAPVTANGEIHELEGDHGHLLKVEGLDLMVTFGFSKCYARPKVGDIVRVKYVFNHGAPFALSVKKVKVHPLRVPRTVPSSSGAGPKPSARPHSGDIMSAERLTEAMGRVVGVSALLGDGSFTLIASLAAEKSPEEINALVDSIEMMLTVGIVPAEILAGMKPA
jgi:uncharacterized LabA/DUF88 family protein